MTDSSLPFELISIVALTLMGSALLLLELPGLGLISTAFLLASMSIGLRLVSKNEPQPALVPIKAKGE